MTNPGFTRTPTTDVAVQTVAITSIDVVNHRADGRTKQHNVLNINTAYHVGAVQVTPALGDQWYVQKYKGEWRLLSRIPFNDPAEALTEPTQGQMQVGTPNGPLELHGSTVNFNAPAKLLTVPASGRPAASSVDPGTMVYDITLNRPIWSNGNNWHLADGTEVLS